MTFHDRFQRIVDCAISGRCPIPFPPGNAQLRVKLHCFLGAKRGSEVASCTGAPDGGGVGGSSIGVDWLHCHRALGSGD